MDQPTRSTPDVAPPAGYRSLQQAATMLLKAFPNRTASMRASPMGTLLDQVGWAGSVIARELPLYGRNTCSHVFEPILSSHKYVLSEDLTRAEHRVWPKAPGGTYIELAVNADEFDTYLHKEIKLNLMRSRRNT